MNDNDDLKKLNLEDFHLQNQARLMPFAGYNMPINYNKGILSEHNNTRSYCGLFDVSHMLQLEIKESTNSNEQLEKIIPLNLNRLKIGKCYYSFILNNKGGIIDDLIISKLKSKKNGTYFNLVLNASRREQDLYILYNTIQNKEDIVEKINHNLLALQGPKSRELIYKIFSDFNDLKFMEINNFIIDNTENTISCSGYTGEDGFELSLHKDVTVKIISKILEDKNVYLCGLGARDTLRLEAGLCLYGNELNENITPKDANLLWAIPKSILNSSIFFIDKDSDNTRVGIKSKNSVIPRNNFEIFNSQNKLIGRITSGSFSPSLKQPIAMAIIDTMYAKPDSEIFFKARNKIEPAIVCSLPFISHKYKR